MTKLIPDVRQAVRNLMQAPGVALVSILTLALGIGANTAMFSVVNAVILRPLPYPRPEQLVYISSRFPALGFDQFWVSPPEFFEFQERTRAFSSVGALATGDSNLSAPERPRRVHAARASADLFTTLGVSPRRGRTFDVRETRPGGASVVILSDEVWRAAFGADASLMGREVEVDGVRRTVIGIMPPGFDVADERVEIWLPLVLDPAARSRSRGSHYLSLIGRLAEGQTLRSAQAELQTLLASWQQSVVGSKVVNPDGRPRVHAPDPTQHPFRLDALRAQVVGGARTAVWVLQGAVLFVLLIACANLANLLLARAESRRREFAIRSALGASHIALLRQFVVEGCALSLAGAIVGLAIAFWGTRSLLVAFPESLPRAGEISLDLTVLAFTVVVALTTGAVFGLAPLMHIAPQATAQSLKESGQRTTSGRHHVRRVLVVAEVALAVSLVIGAGLLLRTVWNLSQVDSGFNRSRLVTFLVDPPAEVYKSPDHVIGLFTRLLDRLRALPGIQSVAAMSGLPPLRRVDANDTDIEGYVVPPGGPFKNIDYYQVATTGYVETMGIPIVEGRGFLPTDVTGPPVVLINETMARTFWHGQRALGHRVQPSGPPNTPWFTVVGVLKDVKQGGVDRKTGTELYFNFEQLLRQLPGYGQPTMNVVIRTTEPAESLAAPIREVVRELDPSLPVVKLRAMNDVFAEAIARPRLLARLLLVFAGVALLLAAIGAYGVLSYLVADRRREIGIRMALGADRGTVLWAVLGQGMRLTALGVLTGLLVAFGVTRVLASLLFGVRPFDVPTVTAVIGLISAVALGACYLPARSATAVDPMIVLRDE